MNQLKYVRSRSTEKVSPFGRQKKVPNQVPSTGRPCVEVLKSSRPQSPRSQDQSTTRVQQILNLLDNHLRAQQTPIRKTSLRPISAATYSQSDWGKITKQEQNIISPAETIKNRLSKEFLMNEKEDESQNKCFNQSNDWKNKFYKQNDNEKEQEQNAADSQVIYNKNVSKSLISKQYLLDFMKVLDMSQDKSGDNVKLQNSKIQNTKKIISTPQLSSLRSSQDNLNDKSRFKLNCPNEIDENFYLDQINPLNPNQITKNQESTTRTQQSINFQEIYETNKLHYEQPYIDVKQQQQEEKYQRKVKEIEIMAVPIDYETIQKNISGSYEEMEIVLELTPLSQNLQVPSLNLFNNNRKGKQSSLVVAPNPILEQLEEEDTKQSERNLKSIQIENYSQLKTDKSEVLLVKEVKDTEIQTSQIIEQGQNDNNERLDTQQSNTRSNVLQIKQHFENMGSTNDAQSQTKFKKKNLGIYSYEISFLSPCSKKTSQAHLDLLSGDTSTQTKQTINPTQLMQPLPRLRIQSSIKENSQQSMMSAFNFETPQMSGTKTHQFNFCKQQQVNNDSQSYLLLTQQSDLFKSKEQLLDPPSESYDQYMQANLERIWAQDAVDMNSNRYQKKKNSNNNSRISKKNSCSNQTFNTKSDNSQYSQHLRQIQSMQKKQLDPYFEYKRAVNKSLAASSSTQKKKSFK